MSSYIGKLSIDSAAALPIGSTLFGICNNDKGAPAKEVTLANFDTLIQGVTVHVKFTNGNNAPMNNSLTLKIGSTDAQIISNPGGSAEWSEGSVISFTYDETDVNNKRWIANDGNVTTIAVNNTYDSTSQAAISGQGVAAAITGLQLDEASQKGVVTTIVENGNNANKTSTDLPTTYAVTSYVDSKTAGLTSAMHFKGTTTTTMTDGLSTAAVVINGNSYTPEAGDVVVYNNQEYVWTGTLWELLGDESSYALKSSTDTITEVNVFTANTLPQLTVTSVSIPNVTNAGSVPQLTVTPTSIPNVTSAGTMTTASVTSGVLNITIGTVPTLGDAISVGSASDWDAGSIPTLGTAISVGSASDWNAGTQASLTTNNTTVIVPTTT